MQRKRWLLQVLRQYGHDAYQKMLLKIEITFIVAAATACIAARNASDWTELAIGAP
jgi:hypothetical protein